MWRWAGPYPSRQSMCCNGVPCVWRIRQCQWLDRAFGGDRHGSFQTSSETRCMRRGRSDGRVLYTGGNWAECSTESASIIECWVQDSIINHDRFRDELVLRVHCTLVVIGLNVRRNQPQSSNVGFKIRS